MSEDETDELPFARRIHPASSPTTEWERGQRQHAGCSDQEILRHTTQQQKSRPIESSQGREILASLRTFDGSGLLLLGSVSENLLIATTSVLTLASFPLSCWT